MSGTDIFVAIISAVMLFGGLYLNIQSRRLSASYADAHKVQQTTQKTVVKNTKVLNKK